MPDKILIVLKSRKFWTLIASLLAAGAAFATGEITVWQALIAAVTALAVYAGAIAVEDGLSRLGTAARR